MHLRTTFAFVGLLVHLRCVPTRHESTVQGSNEHRQEACREREARLLMIGV